VLPYEGEPIDVTPLVEGRPIEWLASDGHLTVRVPDLHLFEAVRITGPSTA
jgi:hypothetical protein